MRRGRTANSSPITSSESNGAAAMQNLAFAFIPVFAVLVGTLSSSIGLSAIQLALIASGQAALVVGTHAMIQDKVQFHNLALTVIDEVSAISAPLLVE